MLTKDKIELFKSYKGYYDGYHIQNSAKGKIISDDEWFLLSNLIHDIYIIRKGLCPKSFEINVRLQLKENCDSQETINLVLELEKY